jgi:hypothetical protein
MDEAFYDLSPVIAALAAAAITTTFTSYSSGSVMHIGEHRRAMFDFGSGKTRQGEPADPAADLGADWRGQLSAGPMFFDDATQRWTGRHGDFCVGPDYGTEPIDDDQAARYWYPEATTTPAEIASHIIAQLATAPQTVGQATTISQRK